MKICIVTVYNSINAGSFWQAYALGDYLKSKHNEVFYLKRDKSGTSASLKNKIVEDLRYLKKNGFDSFIKSIIMHQEYKKLEKNFSTINKNNIEDIDCFILGSDTIWNFDSKYFLDNIEIYSGFKLPKNKKIVSYAASFGNTSIEKIHYINDIKKKFSNIDVISVRDNYSGKIINKFFNKNCDLVCDPTMLFEKIDYEKYINKNEEKNKYILLYLFKKLNDNQLKSLIDYAKKNNKQILEFNTATHSKFKIIMNTPINLLNYFYYADFVITDTFHGTMFSVNLEKQFYVINRNKNKVNDFLKIVNLENRIINDNQSFIKSNYSFIDYKNNKNLTILRDNSRKFIDNNILK